jgi:1-deoxy-D-xylulose-5-phosphate reductoisomerase
MQMLTILGATGSIGLSTLDVVARHPDRFKVFALSCHSKVIDLAEQCRQFKPCYAVASDATKVDQLKQLLEKNCPNTEVLSGVEGLCQIATVPDVDTVLESFVGAAGILPTLDSAKLGNRVLLANKESLVMAGPLFMNAVKQGGATLLPIDSEHNAIFQCLPSGYSSKEKDGIRKILLTASGGPFRQVPMDTLSSMTPKQACAHPNWDMGRKISVDSATMMNKGLELIEACWLFSVSPEEVEVVIHPQSIIHSMVEYVDGSVLAQLGNPDMRTPIAHAMAWPERIDSGVSSLDIIATAQLDFEAPDLERFPCLALAMQAARLGGSAPTILSAANEVAVEAFLDRKITFTQIAEIVAEVLNQSEITEPDTLEAVQLCDRQARQYALGLC